MLPKIKEKLRVAGGHQKLEEGSPSTNAALRAVEGVGPCRHLDFGFQTEYISVLLNNTDGAYLLHQPQESLSPPLS